MTSHGARGSGKTHFLLSLLERVRARCGIVVFLLAIAARAASAAENLKPGNYEFSIEFGGVERTYLVHMPPMVRSEPAPVVINFHGGGGNAKAQEKYSGMDVTA